MAPVLLITGASRGIGKAIAIRLAADGAAVVVTGKTVETHRTLPGTIYTAAEEIRSAGGSALAVPMDVRDEAQVETAVNRAIDKFGRIDVLVNNAGIGGTGGVIEEQTDVQWLKIISTNLLGRLRYARAVVPSMRERRAGTIVNVSSIAGRMCSPTAAR